MSEDWRKSCLENFYRTKLLHYFAALRHDPKRFAIQKNFEIFLKKENKSDIPLEYQEIILKYNPRLAEYIPNLDPKFKRTKQAVSFGLFE